MKGSDSQLKLSPRQATLLKRLELVCERVATKPLPVFVEEVWGFGSLFRAKERPGDLDLLMKYSDRNPLYDLFRALMDKALKHHKQFSTPSEALSHVMHLETNDSRTLQLLSVFSDWLDGITWKKVYSGFIPGLCYSWDTLTKQLLTKAIPRVSIQLAGVTENIHLKAESMVLLWSKSKPDVQYHLSQALDDAAVRQGILKELANFDKQIYTGRVEANVLEKIFQTLRGQDPPFEKRNEFEKWMHVEAQRQFPNLSTETISKIIQNIYMIFAEDPKIPFDHVTSNANITLKELKEEVEKKRTEVDETRWQLEVFRATLKELVRWKREKLYENSWFAKWPVELWVAMETLQNVPKALVSEEKIRENLRKLGLPEDRVLPERGYGKTQYTIPENVEEEEKIRKRNLHIETQRKYVQKLQPEIRRIKKDLSLEVELNEDMKPSLFRIWHIHKFWSGEEVPESARIMIDWCKTRCFTIEEEKYHTYGELVIPAEHLADLKEMKDEIRKRLTISPNDKS